LDPEQQFLFEKEFFLKKKVTGAATDDAPQPEH
jgi:hypothetical protein